MPDREARYLIFGVGELLGAIPLKYVSETMRRLPIEVLADMPPFVRGVSIIRGDPTPVLDASTLMSSRNDIQMNRLISLKLNERAVALAVETIIGIRTIPQQSLQELPSLLNKTNFDTVAAVGALDSKLLIMLNAGYLVPDGLWEAIEARGAAV